MIESRRMSQAKQVARMAEIRNAYNILVGNSGKTESSKGQGTDENVILELILEK
jgi:hypothetical protein